MRQLQAVTLGLIALIITPGYLFYFDVTPKIVVLLLGAATLLAAGAIRGASKSFSVLIVLNLVSLAVSTALSSRPGLSLMGTNWREFGLVPQAAALLFAWTVAGSAANSRIILRGIAIAGIISSAYGITQYFGWDPILPAAAYHIGEGIWTIVRPPGTLGYASYFATWLVVSVFLCLALERLELDLAWRWTARAAAAICAVAMVLTGTRAALVALIAGALIWLYFRGFRITRRMVVSVVAVLASAVGFYLSPAGWNLHSRTRWFAEDRSGGARILLWRDTLRMASHQLAIGYGPEVYTAEFAKVESSELAAAYPDFSYESPHNMFLDVLVSQGIPGLLALLAFCALGLIAGFRTPRIESPFLAAALTAGIVSQQFTVSTVPTAVIIYITVGLLVEPGPIRLPRAVAAALALALVYYAVRLVAADCALESTQQALQAGDASTAAARYAKYQRWRTGGATSDIWYSRACLQLAQKTESAPVRLQAMLQAQRAGAHATTSADNSFDAWFNLSEFDAIRNDAQSVERDLRAAIQARPNWFKPHWALARLLALERRHDEAKQEAALAVTLDGGKDAEVTQTLMDIRNPLHK